MSTIAYIPSLVKPPKAVIAEYSHAGTLANAGKKGFVTVICLIISRIIDAGKRYLRKKCFATGVCSIISSTFTLAKTHPLKGR